jgi:hypothetical protein
MVVGRGAVAVSDGHQLLADCPKSAMLTLHADLLVPVVRRGTEVEEPMSGWVTFWTAVGAVGTCAAIFVGTQGGSDPRSVTPSTPTVVLGAPADASLNESSDIGTTRFSGYVYDDTCSCNRVRSLPAGAKIRLNCVAQGASFTKNGRSSTTWYQVDGGYVSDVLVSTSSQFSPDRCV